MCNGACESFGQNNLTVEEIEGKRILEVGALNVNGSLRQWVMGHSPKEYIGIDIQEGPCVDKILNAVDIVKHFGTNSFDAILSTEMMEHVEDWRTVIYNFKNAVKVGGVILITTRSEGFGLHSYPADWWRYSQEDMRNIFSDFENVIVEPDNSEPGVFVKARKPENWKMKYLGNYELFNINTGKRNI